MFEFWPNMPDEFEADTAAEGLAKDPKGFCVLGVEVFPVAPKATGVSEVLGKEKAFLLLIFTAPGLLCDAIVLSKLKAFGTTVGLENLNPPIVSFVDAPDEQTAGKLKSTFDG